MTFNVSFFCTFPDILLKHSYFFSILVFSLIRALEYFSCLSKKRKRNSSDMRSIYKQGIFSGTWAAKSPDIKTDL